MQPRLRLDIGWRDLASALLPPRSDRAALEARIGFHAPDDVHAVTALSVRSLFDAILAETGNAPVVMSGITIADMPALVRAHGREVRTVDIDLERLAPSPDETRIAAGNDAGLVVVAHLYGGRNPVDRIASAVASILLIEDCAQAFDGKLGIAPGAAIALYSFGPIKKATALGGAVGLFRDAALAARIRRRMEASPALPESWFLRRLAKYAGLKILNIPVVYSLFLAILRSLGKDPEIVIGRMARGFGAGRPIAEAVRYRPPLRLLRLLDRRLGNWRPPPDATPALLQELAQRLTVPGLASQPGNWWLAPVLSADPDALISTLRASGYDATRGTTSMRAIADDAGNTPPLAAHLIGSVVYLPKPATETAASRLAKAVESALN